tara:strand:+ start:240 stop:695 length:456 start_codon:yes stop_codon:yes gene_type:complete
MSDNAYYVKEERAKKIRLPKGEYEAVIINLEMVNNIRCGKFIADVFKPVYKVIYPDNPSVDVKDGGIFRYKEKVGYEFEPSRNWGFAKFCEILGVTKEENGKVSLPYLNVDMMDGFKVLVEINHKSFVNKTGMSVEYPVATLKKKIGEVPF